jgi:hypothetical protein
LLKIDYLNKETLILIVREKIAREREAVDRLSKEISEEIEALILGIKRIQYIEKH